MFSSLLKEVQERADTFLPQLQEADTMTLQHQTKSTQDKFNRLALFALNMKYVWVQNEPLKRENVSSVLPRNLIDVPCPQNTVGQCPKIRDIKK